MPAETVSSYGPGVVTREIIQDANGDLWFASFSGVVRYDGNQYTNVTNQSLQPTRAFSLLRDRHDHIWIGTAGAGVYRHDGASYTRFTARDGLGNDQVLSMGEDRDGNLWFGHRAGGVTRYDGDRFTVFGAKDGFTDGDVSSITQDPSGRIWFGTRDGLYHFDGESFAILEEATDLPTGGFIPTLVDDQGDLWFGGESGLHHYDGVLLHRLTTEPVWALASSSDGGIWFGGESVLQQVRPGLMSSMLGPEIVEVATGKGLLFDIFEDRHGVVWIGTFGVAQRDGSRIRKLDAAAAQPQR